MMDGGWKPGRYGWERDIGEIGKPRMLAVDKLEVDEQLQRKRSEANVADIARNFNWPEFGALDVVAVGDGRYIVVDGQHRLEAARRRAVTSVPCRVVVMSSREEQARFLVEKNSRIRRMDADSKFRLLVVAGESTATAVSAMLARLDLRPGTRGPGGVRFLARLLRDYAANPTDCAAALSWQVLAIGRSDDLSDLIHRGAYAMFRRLVSGEPETRCSAILEAGGKGHILHAINARCAVSGARQHSDDVCCAGVVECVNRGLRSRRITVEGITQ